MDHAGPMRRDYERPQETWQCGHACREHWCILGPTPVGTCQAGPECQPIERDGTWRCTRGRDRGGPCPDGPDEHGNCGHVANDCLPRASLRGRRQAFTCGCGVLALGILMMILGSNWRNEFLAPGELFQSHAQILGGDRYRERCAACHDAGERAVEAWSWSAVAGRRTNSTPQWKKCLDCHDKQMAHETAVLAHSMPAAELLKITTTVLGRTDRFNLWQTPDRAADRAIECAACHREHHGRDFDLTRVSDHQCQTCHANQFASFRDGHPEFGQWPYTPQAGLAFDHRSHARKHFPDLTRDFSCGTCHQASPGASVVRLRPYAESCADCHEPKIAAILSSGLDLITLPLLDLRALADQRMPVAGWPEDLNGDFDGRIPLSMQLLLQIDPPVREALSQLGDGGDFSDIDFEDVEQIRAGAIVARALVRMMVRLGRDARGTFDAQPATQPLAPLVDVLPQTWWIDSFDRWFQEGRPVFEGLGAGSPDVNTAADSATNNGAPAVTQVGGPLGKWERRDDQYRISYHPAGHADRWLHAWLDVVVSESSRDHLPDESWRSTPEATACLVCHPVRNGRVHWNVIADTHSAAPGFTKFRHEPHLVQPQLRDCSACHALSDASLPTTPRISSDQEFLPLSKATCQGCHTPNGAGDACVQCHSYHLPARSASE